MRILRILTAAIIALCLISCAATQGISTVARLPTYPADTHYLPFGNSIIDTPKLEELSGAADAVRPQESAKDYFTLGSDMNHVASVMGTPTRTDKLFSETWWYYHYSKVVFRESRVAEWSNRSGNLKVHIVPPLVNTDFFTQGSKPDEVVAAMGTPTEIHTLFNEIWWYYRYSKVVFRDGRVSEWDNRSDNLKVRWSDSQGKPAESPPTKADSSLGSVMPRGSVYLPSSSGTLRSPSLYLPKLSDGFVDPHYRSGTSVRGYFRKDGTYVSPHYRSGSRIGGFSR
jgi:outer membrane protein assembly factor BamE (lipoprotein component of BamABCDE complex)